MNLMQMSLSGAFMILAIVIIRALAINKLPKKAFSVLWGVAAVRLLIPYSLCSSFSIYSLLGWLAAAEEAVNDIPVVPFISAAPVQNMVPVPDAAAANTAAVNINPWVIAWVIGALVCALFFTAAYLKCRREFKMSLPVDNGYVKVWLSEHRIRRTIEIRRSDRISAPLTYGVFHPVILMPKTADWDDLDTLKYVLTHEYVHIRRFDVVSKLVLTIVLCIHWFNPAVWVMYILANRDMELSCDEAVIRQFGERTKSAYAMALIRMEETRSGLNPLCNNFSKNAIEERIVAIMKIKKTSLAALIGAAALVAGVTTAFATSAKDDGSTPLRDSDYASDTVTEKSDLLSYIDSKEGKTYYSLAFEALTDEEFKARFPSLDVEWWTYDEYKAWLENEKAELQGLIGERCWTSSRGEFVWTQEIVDETIAMYEDILENIKNGMLYSKTIDGEDASVTLSSGSAAEEGEIYEGDAAASDFSQYEPFGLVWDEDEKALFWNGERVRYFFDGVDMDDMGGMAVRFEYADADLAGNIDVHTVRRRVLNDDGSFNFMGPLTGLEKYSQEEYDRNTLRFAAAQKTEGAVSEVTLAENAATENTTEEVSAVSAAQGNAAEPGTSFEEIFKKYAPFGITYEEAEGNSGKGNVYYNGQLVGTFADLTPDGGAFVFSSAEQGNITVKTAYDDDGRLTGAEPVGSFSN